MKTFSAVVALVALIPSVLGLTINTPTSVVQCQPIQLTWSDGTAPYFLSLLPGGQPSATPLESFDSTTSTSFTWTVNLPSGTSVTAQIKDSTGTIAYSDIFTIQSGSDSSCLTSSGVAGATSGGSSATTSGAAATTTGTGSSGASATAKTSGSAAATGSGTASPSASSTSSSSNAARGSSISAFGIAGVMGLVGAALF
ncbi:hypothetical protein PUNSTDRAFT_92211 [Punctularia strigosozonata HHB-11173 SS5]|uniref:Uncharacterized protein n=1 Tax=Punctularia strigosozonata (strain HHB-11173) TaxID=741275 RepID=R7S343_PUNST|nr:uncharacterized protein PUNSTDRAFT_92211 [Punctularia strigosozonata HHB-11173 SS5]EIN04805.1 hypothetical protein PUNSTDRAFT_92211 [Punctularia strigosozonata HHB-11173 SS5]